MVSNNADRQGIKRKSTRRTPKEVSESLTTTIVDYYHRFGKNRDLEKYLKLRKIGHSSSSTDSGTDGMSKALKNLSILNSATSPMENVESLPRIVEYIDKFIIEETKATITKDTVEERGAREGAIPKGSKHEQSNKSTKENATQFSNDSTKGNKKHFYNLSMESNIEINIQPEQERDPPFVELFPNPNSVHKSTSMELSSETQPNLFEPFKVLSPMPPINESSQIITAQKQPPEQRSVSTQSDNSIVNRDRLEWDSLADVGYEQSLFSTHKELSEFEYRVLRKFFAKQGYQIFNKKEQITLKRRNLPEGSDTIRSDEITDKWKKSLEKFRKKYGDGTSHLQFTNPTIHSTPITNAKEDKINKQVENISQKKIAVGEKENIFSKKFERSCQTSPLNQLSKEIQVQFNRSSTNSTKSKSDLDSFPIDNKSSLQNKRPLNTTEIGKTSINAGSEYLIIESIPISNEKLITQPTNDTVVIGVDQILQRPSSKDSERLDNYSELNIELLPIREVNIENNLLPDNGLTDQENSKGIESGISDLPGLSELSINLNSLTLKDDVQKGIDLLTELAKSNQLDDKKKSILIRKIVKRLIANKYPDSSISSKKSSKILTNSLEERVKRSKESGEKSSSLSCKTNNENKKVEEWLKPITHSEIDYENHKLVGASEIPQIFDSIAVDDCVENVQRCAGKSRKIQLNWIAREIEHLDKLKTFLTNKQSAKGSDSNKPYTQTGLLTDRTTNLTDKILETGSQPTSGDSNTKIYKNKIDKSVASSSIDDNDNSPNGWNSHLNMQKMARNRTKLQTPDSFESMQEYADIRKTNFLKKYNDGNRNKLYTKVYSTMNHYSEPRRQERNKKQPIAQPYTPGTVNSDQFVSSNSVSINVPANSTSSSTTTTHQNYIGLSSGPIEEPEAKLVQSIAIQTSGSLFETERIFTNCSPLKPVRYCCRNPFGCFCNIQFQPMNNTSQPTQRVNRLNVDKQQQTIAPPISYIITFLDNGKWKNVPAADNIANNSDNNSEHKYENNQNIGRTETIGPNNNFDNIALKEYLINQRPDFMIQADERRKYLKEINNLRQQRNIQRTELLQATNKDSLMKNLQNLPPPPLSQKRLFSTKSLRKRTQKKYKQLPEIKRKKYVEKIQKIKSSNRMLTDMFNKNLQNRVLRGKTDLSNSMSIL